MNNESQTSKQILGPDGKPYVAPEKKSVTQNDSTNDRYSAITAYSSFLSSIYGTNATALRRSLEPFISHAWVYAGAMAIARNLTQAPFTIYRETKNTQDKRATNAIAKGYQWIDGGRCGRRRGAIQRHLNKPKRLSGQVIRGVDPDDESPYQLLFNRPNFLMTSDQFWTAHWLWMVLRGKCIWLKTNPDGSPFVNGDVPDQIFPMSPDLFTPVFENNLRVGWRMRTPLGLGRQNGAVVYLTNDEITEFQYFNPRSMVDGFSPLVAAGNSVRLDMMLIDSEIALLENGSEPVGVVMVDKGSEFADESARSDFYTQWEQRHKGERKKGRVALLEGMKYLPTGLSPHEMQGLATRQWDRDEVLAVLGVPKTVVGVTEETNRATAMVVDRSFWDRTLVPMAMNTEQTIDGTLLYMEADSLFGGFDFSRVKSLQAQLAEQVGIAIQLSGPEIHMPPKLSLDMAGIDVEEYDGDDVAFIPSINVPVNAAIEEAENPTPPTIPALPGPNDNKPTDDGTKPPAEISPEDAKPKRNKLTRAQRKAKAESLWRTLIRKVQRPAEKQFAGSWKSYIRKEKSIGLQTFDDALHSSKKKFYILALHAKVKSDFDPNDVLQDLTGMKNRLKIATAQAYDTVHKKTFDFTIEEVGGVSVFHIDDPALMAVIETRKKILVGSAPETIQNRIRGSLNDGITAGETMNQLRDRVASVYDISASDAKSLAVARTESAGTMNALRNEIYASQNIEYQEWTTAEDEHVRESHAEYGASGPHKTGFNYLEISGKDGSLTYAGDPDAPAEEVVNCRCCMIASDSPDENDSRDE